MWLLCYFVFAPLAMCVCQETSPLFSSYSDFYPDTDFGNESFAIKFLDEYNFEVRKYLGDVTGRQFDYFTNITKENMESLVEAMSELSYYMFDIINRALFFNMTNFSFETQRRIDALLQPSLGGTSAAMVSRYSQAKACLSRDKCFALDPDLTRIMAKSRDYDELYWAWDTWRTVAGQPSRDDFIADVTQRTQFADRAGFSDVGAHWRSAYEVDDMEDRIRSLYSKIAPLYTQLHAYVRRKLYNYYGPDYINLRGPIPAHLLGNMWAQYWRNILDIVQPYPGNASLELEAVIRKKFHTGEDLFRTAEHFFESLGMLKAPKSFWDESVFDKPQDGRKLVCHGTAWDFRNQKDFRISMCADVTLLDFLVAHHEMGHIQYYMQYADQPIGFGNGANPGFHEAMGDVITLSVSTPEYHRDINLTSRMESDEEADINFLMGQALDKIATIPYSFIVDIWRWGVFNGSIPVEKYNTKWWQLREQYQGVIPPTPRSEIHFDPPSKYHISACVPYLRYFVSSVIQFQFHQALCNASGHAGPLFKCNLYNSTKAGELLSKAMKMGSSRHWTDVMKTITGQSEMQADAILEYFKPLSDWLGKQNENEILGWDQADGWYPRAPEPWPGKGSVVTCSLMTLLISLFLNWTLT